MAFSPGSPSTFERDAAMAPPEVKTATVLPLPCLSIMAVMSRATRALSPSHASMPSVSYLPVTQRSMAVSKTLLNDFLLEYIRGSSSCREGSSSAMAGNMAVTMAVVSYSSNPLTRSRSGRGLPCSAKKDLTSSAVAVWRSMAPE